MAKVVRKLVSNVVKPIRRNLVYDLVQRNFTTLQAAFGQYYSLGTPVTLSGDFEIECLISTTATSYERIFALYTDVFGEHLHLSLNYAGAIGKLKIESAGHTPGNGNIIVNDGKLNRIKVSVNTLTGVIRIYVNDILDYTTTHTNPSKLSKSFYMLAGAGRAGVSDTLGGYFSGIISNVKIKSSGTLIHSWALDSDGSTSTEIDSVGGNNATRVNLTAADTELFTKTDEGDWLGSIDLTNSNFNFGTYGSNSDVLITKNSNKSVSANVLTTSSTYVGIKIGGNNVLPNGSKALITYDADQAAVDNAWKLEGDPVKLGRNTQKVTSGYINSAVIIIRDTNGHTADTTITFDNISLKRLIEVA